MKTGSSDPQYALNKLHQAVRALATHPGPPTERLVHALREMSSASEGDFRLEALEAYEAIQATLRPHLVLGEGYRFPSDEVALSIANKLIDLWHIHHDETCKGATV